LKTGLLICGEVNRWHDTLEQATIAEALGYDSAWIAEHHFLDTGYGPAPLVNIAALAEVTERLTLGPAVLLPAFYHPVRLAEETALIQNMTGGRFVCGLGLGYRPEEFEAFGAVRSKRRHYLEESIQLLSRLWTEVDVTFKGEVYDIESVTISPRPELRPPIWVGGWVEAAIDRAARLADAWFPGPTADLSKLKSAYSYYESALQREGKAATERPLIREMWVGATEHEIAIGRSQLTEMYEEEYRSWGQENVGEGDVLEDRAIVGSPQQVTEEIERWKTELSFDHIVGRMHIHGMDQKAVLRSMELFAEQVRPALKE
jgi:alkanesulfonate monooxygenase SsuD/methylene tetrahydromethanopterin reductase-like flavin-dependent oxidoreductase (luciferase family)